eukprot:scaffold6913_cov169-Ochromonas_danica.AAC.1
MFALPEISVNEEIQFVRSILIPSFDKDNQFKTSKERKEWIKATAKDDGWPENMATLLNRIYSTISSLDEAKAEKEKLEAKQERQHQTAASGGLESGIKEINQSLKKVTFAIERQAKRLDEIERPTQALLSKVSASNTDHGVAIYNSLMVTGNIKVYSDGAGSSIIADDLISEAKLIYNQNPRPHEQHLVSLYTPALTEILEEVNPDLRLVNSEYCQWLRCMSGHRKSDLKPDLFSAHHPLIQYSPPYSNAPKCAVRRLFGRFVGWENRSSIHCIWDGKWRIDMQAFGEKCKYLQIVGEDCVDHNGVALKLKGVLFDKDEFWMIKSSGNTITDVEICRWNQSGSKQLMIGFLQGNNPWLAATNALCEELGVTIVDYSNSEQDISAWLGTGANGRVFRLNGGQVIKIVVGRKSDEVEKEYLLMLQHHKWEAITSLVFPVVEGSYRCGVILGVQYAGYLLAQEGEQIPLPVTNDLKKELGVSLCELHSHSVIHGDPRIENALVLDGVVRWIDFRLSETVTTKISRRRDVEILYKSLGGSVDAASEEIEAYVNGPTVENLLCVLFK